MAWVVDTCLVIDVLEDDVEFGRPSALLLDSKASDGLVLCPVSYIELAPAFLGDSARQHDFLNHVGIDYTAPWDWAESQATHKAWARFIALRRAGQAPRRPIPEVLIGAFATTRQGLLTRNPSDFAAVFPFLDIVTPS